MLRCSPPPPPRLRSPRGPRGIARTGLALAACALLSAGCEEERHIVSSKRPQTRAPGIAGVDVSGGFDAEQRPNPAPAARPAAPAKKKEPVFIVNRRTQDIKDANAPTDAGARQASSRIVARDPITLQGNAYVVAIGQIAVGQIKKAVDLFQAENGRYPKDYDEFMAEIIKKNNISLPRLPHYQEYRYDADQHKLIVIEYPDRK